MTQQIFYAVDQAPVQTVTTAVLAQQTAFLAKLSGVSSYGWEDKSNGATQPLSVSTGSGGTAITTTVTGTASKVDITNAASGGRFNTTSGGGLYLRAGNGPAEYVDFAFSQSVSAFGAYFTDVGDFGGTFQITLTSVGGGTQTIMVYDATSVSATSGNIFFWGIVDIAARWTSVRFVTTGGSAGDLCGIDDLLMATPSQVVGNGSNVLIPHPMVMVGGEYAKGRLIGALRPLLVYGALPPAPPTFWSGYKGVREVP